MISSYREADVKSGARGEVEGETRSTCRWLSWFSRLTVADIARVEEERSVATWVSNIRDIALSRSPFLVPPARVIGSSYGYIPLPPPLPDPRPRDDVNARRHNDESRRVAGQEVELLAMVAAAGLCYLPNRMKKRAPSGPSSRKWGDTVRSKSSFFYLPPPPPSYLSPPAPSSSSSIVLPSSLSRLLTEGGTDRCEGGQKTGLRGVMRQINIGALQIVHA